MGVPHVRRFLRAALPLLREPTPKGGQKERRQRQDVERLPERCAAPLTQPSVALASALRRAQTCSSSRCWLCLRVRAEQYGFMQSFKARTAFLICLGFFMAGAGPLGWATSTFCFLHGIFNLYVYCGNDSIKQEVKGGTFNATGASKGDGFDKAVSPPASPACPPACFHADCNAWRVGVRYDRPARRNGAHRTRIRCGRAQGRWPRERSGRRRTRTQSRRGSRWHKRTQRWHGVQWRWRNPTQTRLELWLRRSLWRIAAVRPPSN